MGKKIRMEVGPLVLEAELNDSPTAQKVWEALPFEAVANRWGDEVYFEIPVKAPLEPGAKEVVEKGDIGYWPTGHAMCLFFGPTPISQGEEIRPASAVSLIGKIYGDPTVLKEVSDGQRIYITRLED